MTDRKLGFSLPAPLRSIYLDIGNGGRRVRPGIYGGQLAPVWHAGLGFGDYRESMIEVTMHRFDRLRHLPCCLICQT